MADGVNYALERRMQEQRRIEPEPLPLTRDEYESLVAFRSLMTGIGAANSAACKRRVGVARSLIWSLPLKLQSWADIECAAFEMRYRCGI